MSTTSLDRQAVKVFRTIAELKQELRQRRSAKPGLTTGFVPTMGYLHEGHATLMRRAKAENDYSVLSIFVNPLQFGPNEDFDRYPRDEERDLALAASIGIDAVFMPSVSEMYPVVPQTRILISEVTSKLCGASRPGHFDGVGLVVSKLFNLVEPDKAYFGLKDAQQVAVISAMVRDLNIPVEIVAVPTVRERDGLALSSRNVYLSEDERSEALVLSGTLASAKEWATENGMTIGELNKRVQEKIGSSPLAQIDYAQILYYPTLEQPQEELAVSNAQQPLIVALAVKFGTTRLIDNVIIGDIGEVNNLV